MRNQANGFGVLVGALGCGLRDVVGEGLWAGASVVSLVCDDNTC